MTYRLRESETTGCGLTRIVREQIDAASEALQDGQLDRGKAVHQARKRFKKIRAVIRLLRPRLGEIYRTENVCFRDAGRKLAIARDAEVLLATLDALREYSSDSGDVEAFERVREALASAAGEMNANHELERRVDEVLASLEAARTRLQSWPVGRLCGFTVVEAGYRKTFKRGRRAMTAAYESGGPEAFHNWRKRVKYHWYQSRILRNVWPDVMTAHCKAVKRLGELLGREHDLTLLADHIQQSRPEGSDAEAFDKVCSHLHRWQQDLRRQAYPLGLRVFAEKPKRLCQRVSVYWDAWMAEIQSD